PATEAQITPSFPAFGPDGNLYVSDFAGRVRRIDADGLIRTVAGGGTASTGTGDGGPAIGAYLSTPEGIAIAPDGTLYVPQRDTKRVRRVSPDGFIYPGAGNGAGGYDGDGPPATVSRLAKPIGLTIGPDGNLYIGDSGNTLVRKVDGDLLVNVAGSFGAFVKG